MSSNQWKQYKGSLEMLTTLDDPWYERLEAAFEAGRKYGSGEMPGLPEDSSVVQDSLPTFLWPMSTDERAWYDD